MKYINVNGDKIPVDGRGYKIDHLNPSNQKTLDEALRQRVLTGHNISAVLTGEGEWCLDIDKCVDDAGQLNEIAQHLLFECAKHPVYIEVSTSGRGFHVWGRVDLPIPEHKCKNTALNIELYTADRHIIIGQQAPISPLSEFPTRSSNDLFNYLVQHYFSHTTVGIDQWYDLTLWNNDIIDIDWVKIKRRKSSSVSNPITGQKSLNDILAMDRHDWETSDKSSVDIALLNHLAFNVGPHHDTIERLYRTSNIGTYRANETPVKLDRLTGADIHGTRGTYLQRSILRAIADCEVTYKTPAELKEEKQRERIEEIKQQVTGERGQPDSPSGYYLRDFVCMYNGDSPKFICARTGNELGTTSFKTCFRIDAFEFEQAFPERIVAGKVYSPGEDMIYTTKEGLQVINTYRAGPAPVEPSEVNRQHLDDYFNAIVPNPSERKWLKQWCGHLIQHPTIKILSAVILTGRATGTGKSTLGVLLSKAVGNHNVARITNKTLSDQYNSWLCHSVLAISEELNTSTYGRGRAEQIKESIKEWITTREIGIREMHQTTTNAVNAINAFLFTTNNIDATPVDHEDRRYYVLEIVMNMAIKRLINDGVYTILNEGIPGGEIAGYFHNVDLTGFNPTAFAPTTEAKRTMIELTRDDIEAAIVSAIDDLNCEYITDEYAFTKPLALHLGAKVREVCKHLYNLDYQKYPGKPYLLKQGVLPDGHTHSTLTDKYNLLK